VYVVLDWRRETLRLGPGQRRPPQDGLPVVAHRDLPVPARPDQRPRESWSTMRPLRIVRRPDSRRSVCTPGSSSHDQRSDLDRQVAAFPSGQRGGSPGAAHRGRGRVGDERGTGKAPPFAGGPGGTHVVVEHRDRLGRMNVELVEAALSASGRSLCRAGPRREGRRPGPGHDRRADLVLRPAVRTGRSARNRAEKALRCAARDVGPMALVKEPS